MFRFDESDPQFLIIYTGDEHPKIADYRNLIQRWESRLSGDTRFGVIIVQEPHEHHDDDAERQREDEAEITGLINDFRRRFRTRANRSNLGYATVLSPETSTAMEPAHWQKMQDTPTVLHSTALVSVEPFLLMLKKQKSGSVSKRICHSLHLQMKRHWLMGHLPNV